MKREEMIEKAKAFEADHFANPNDGRFYSDLMADFAIEIVEAQAIQFNDARPAMKEAYQQGRKDADMEREVAAGLVLGALVSLKAELATANSVLHSANIEILPDGSHQFKPKAIKYYCGEITAERIVKLEAELAKATACVEILYTAVRTLDYGHYGVEVQEVTGKAIAAFEAVRGDSS